MFAVLLPILAHCLTTPDQLQGQHGAAGRQRTDGGGEAGDESSMIGESHDQFVMRLTRDFNVAVRERSHDLQLWLDYAAFQDELPRYRVHIAGSYFKLTPPTPTSPHLMSPNLA